MNTFAASIILSQMSLGEFLHTSPEDRVQYFGPYIGHDRLVSSMAMRGSCCSSALQVRFNEELAKRTSIVQLTSSSPVSNESRTPA